MVVRDCVLSCVMIIGHVLYCIIYYKGDSVIIEYNLSQISTHEMHKKFFGLLCLLLPQLSASQWPRHCMVLDRCYMHFVLRHTGGAGHHEIYQLPHYFTTYHLLSSKPANNALQQADLKKHSCQVALREGDW